MPHSGAAKVGCSPLYGQERRKVEGSAFRSVLAKAEGEYQEMHVSKGRQQVRSESKSSGLQFARSPVIASVSDQRERTAGACASDGQLIAFPNCGNREAFHGFNELHFQSAPPQNKRPLAGARGEKKTIALDLGRLADRCGS